MTKIEELQLAVGFAQIHHDATWRTWYKALKELRLKKEALRAEEEKQKTEE